MQHLGRQPYTAAAPHDTDPELYGTATLTALLSIHMSHFYSFTMQAFKYYSLHTVTFAP